MRIAFCIYKYFPFGGLQRDFFRIAKEVVLRGHTVRVYVREWVGERPTDFEIIEVPTHSMSNHGKNSEYFNWVSNHLDSHPVDRVVGFNRMPGLDVYFTGDVCYAEKTKHKNFFYKLTSRYRHFIHFEQAVFNRGLPTKILLLTENRKLEIQEHYHTEDGRFYLLPPGIDIDRKYDKQPQDCREKFREEFALSNEQKLLLQVCSNYELKGVDRSIKALASLPANKRENTFLFVVGEDNPEKMSALAQSLNISDHVRFFRGRNDISRFMLGADLMLHPARQEAAGIVILESIVSCLPIIVSGNCGYSSYVNTASAGVVLAEPFDQNSYNQTLEKVLENSALRQTWHANAKHFADTHDLYGLAKRAADIILQ